TLLFSIVAGARTLRIAGKAARAGVHRREEQKFTGENGGTADAAEADPPFFERLADRFEDIAPKLGQLIQEEDSPMRQGDFSRARRPAASDEARGGDPVMRRAKGRNVHE